MHTLKIGALAAATDTDQGGDRPILRARGPSRRAGAVGEQLPTL
ncbi:hypothetical protein ACRAWD_05325 [Caulobacter segnis]